MRREVRGATGLRAAILASRRELVASLAADGAERWQLEDAMGRWLPPGLAAGEPVVLAGWEIADWVPVGTGAANMYRRFRLEPDDSLTEVERVPGTGTWPGNPVRWRPVQRDL